MSLRHLSILAEDDDDPMLSAINLVDVFLVLVVALLTAVVVQTQASGNDSVTIIRNAGQPDMEVVVREQGREVRFKGAGSAAQGQGVRAGVAYRLEDGNIVYIPEGGGVPGAVRSGAGGPAEPTP
ncbi:MAG TPA: hypothetical protein DET46_05435 [Comamonadaceae bacterium]|jgi:hypothetical protein|nr:MAG: hypothetical protein A3F76_16305 [Burkholderiales bacterium RIFCSPLOWO2_12_FULL_65_40]HCE28278.1 hypothetical protein [Comamonadaceae bacterium]